MITLAWLLALLIPPCPTDDGTPPDGSLACVWVAGERGNHQGDDFVALRASLDVDSSDAAFWYPGN